MSDTEYPDRHWGRHPWDKPMGRPKASEKKKPDITNNEIKNLLKQGKSIHCICRDYSAGKTRVQTINRSITS